MSFDLHNAAIARLEAELAASEVRERQKAQSYAELERMYQAAIEDKQKAERARDRAVADTVTKLAQPTTTNPLVLVPIEDERAAVICEQAAARLRRQSIGTAAAERVARAAIDAEREARETA